MQRNTVSNPTLYQIHKRYFVMLHQCQHCNSSLNQKQFRQFYKINHVMIRENNERENNKRQNNICHKLRKNLWYLLIIAGRKLHRSNNGTDSTKFRFLVTLCYYSIFILFLLSVRLVTSSAISVLLFIKGFSDIYKKKSMCKNSRFLKPLAQNC